MATTQSWTRVGLAHLPGFRESLRLLIEEERYASIDVADMFGVSRERIRQLCERFEITHPDGFCRTGLRAVREWDDCAHRFRPVVKADRRAQALESDLKARREARRVASALRTAERTKQLLAALHACRTRLNRDPLWPELWEEIGHPYTLKATSLLLAWLWPSIRNSREKSRLLYALTGMPPQPRGERSHRRNLSA